MSGEENKLSETQAKEVECATCLEALRGTGNSGCIEHGMPKMIPPQPERFEAVNHIDENGNPTGGFAKGIGIDIQWQNGPLGRDADRKEPNGAFVEDLIKIARQRIQHFQTSKFKSDENTAAISHLTAAIVELNNRTKRREAEGVEGTLQK